MMSSNYKLRDQFSVMNSISTIPLTQEQELEKFKFLYPEGGRGERKFDEIIKLLDSLSVEKRSNQPEEDSSLKPILQCTQNIIQNESTRKETPQANKMSISLLFKVESHQL